jgi:hypothetical protein
MSSYRLKVKRNKTHNINTNLPQYIFSINDTNILIYNAPKRHIVNTFKRLKKGIDTIPSGAIIVLENKEKYVGKLMGGWLCNKLSYTYGLYNGDGFRCLHPEFIWIPTQDEINKLTTYD